MGTPKVGILCGGKGTRLIEHTEEIPKPLVQIGDKPILWHIMKIYSHYGYKDFILCLGYKGEKIKEYFRENKESDWNITAVDTGENSNKGERLMKVKDLIDNDTFFLAYGDDVSDLNLNEIFEYHKSNGKTVTLTGINPESQFGILELSSDNEVLAFKEKPKLEHWINGGFFVVNKKIFDHMQDGWDLETETFEDLAKKDYSFCTLITAYMSFIFRKLDLIIELIYPSIRYEA